MTTITVTDRTTHSADITPEQAIAYARRVLGVEGEMDSGWRAFDTDEERFAVPMSASAEDWSGYMAEFVESMAAHQHLQPSAVLAAIAAEPREKQQ